MKDIYFIRHTPIDVDKQMYEKFAQKWEGKFTVIAETSFSEARKQCGYSEHSEYFDTCLLDETENQSEFMQQLFAEHPDAIYMFNGIGMAEKYKNFISKYNLTYGIVAERDCSIGKSVKYAIKTLFPRLTHLSVRKLVNGCSFFLAMGKSGVRCYKRYGVKESVLYNYMYNVAHTYISPKPYKKGETIRFIYIGRFDFLIKGVDVLIKATEKLNGNFVLDLVGGYGKNRDEVLNQIKTSSNINFLGTWDNKTICEKLNDYDVIIIPSNMDGWNLHNNYAVLSGVGSITSNQSGSDELVENCKNGIVFKAGNVKRLTKAMQSVLENPDVINRWKNNTQDYFSKISAESVSDYLVNIINYAVFGIGETKPIEPWHVKE